MSESQPSKVFLFGGVDPEMQAAYEKARESFRFFWREVAWERRRIVPALDLACVKAPFWDDESTQTNPDVPKVEQMWLSDTDFDGQFVTGTLLNSPNWIKSVKAGDSVRRPLSEITDWMYSIGDVVYGAYTVNVMRSRMDAAERQAHDNAWGRDFGDPNKIRVVPEFKKSGGLLGKLFGGKTDPTTLEHPFSEAMAKSLKTQLASDPSLATSKDGRGWTLLHHQALAGSLATVKILLESGADVNARTDHGMTPLQLAKSLNWNHVVTLLERKP